MPKVCVMGLTYAELPILTIYTLVVSLWLHYFGLVPDRTETGLKAGRETRRPRCTQAEAWVYCAPFQGLGPFSGLE